MDQSEKEIIADIRAGNIDRFTEIIEKYQHLVARMVSQILKSPTDIEEVCQETFIKAYRKLDSFKGDAKFSTWIAKIAYNTSINFVKKKKLPLYRELLKKESPREDTDLPDFEERLLSDLQSPEDSLIQKDVENIMKTAIEKLPLRYRLILILYHQDGFTYEEIAKVTGMPEGTVKNYLFRARKLLKNFLIENYQREEFWI